MTILILVLFLRSKHSEAPTSSLLARIRDIDFVGFTLLSGSTVMVLLALQFGGSYFPWNSSVIIGLFCGAIVTCIVFVVWQWRLQDAAYLPLKVATHRTAMFASLVMLFGSGGFSVIIYYLQIWFQAIKGASPLSGGLMYFPTVIADVLTAVIASGVGMIELSYNSSLT